MLIKVIDERVELYRLDNCIWSYKRTVDDSPDTWPMIEEVRIQTPAFKNPGYSYLTACFVAKAIQLSNVFSCLKNGHSILIDVQQTYSFLEGRWQITCAKDGGFIPWMVQWIPFFKKYPSNQFISIRASQSKKKTPPALIVNMKDFAACYSLQTETAFSWSEPISIAPWDCFEQRIRQISLNDPFTALATKALQTVEVYYVSRRSACGSCRLVLHQNGEMTVKLISPFDDPKENQRTVRKYYEFLIQEFGPWHVKYAQSAYGIDLIAMAEKCLPLLPDHIYKMNVGVNNIEMSHIESLFQRLYLIRDDLKRRIGDASLEDTLQRYNDPAKATFLSMREIRGLLAVGNREITDQALLEQFLNRLVGNVIPDHIPHMPPEQFNALVSMIWPTDEDISRLLTGREIRHLAICGCKTMGIPDENDPCRDLAELLQVCPHLQKTEDWDNFYELLAHVVVKKNLFREHFRSNHNPIWRTGVIIPAPKTEDGAARWYCVNKVCDDGEGNLSYILLPAVKGFHKDGRPLAMIHLYRSSNFNQDAIDSIGSIENDLNPFGAPGSRGEEVFQDAKKSFFFNRTIPLWAALCLYGDIQFDKKKSSDYYRESLDELQRCLQKSPTGEEGALKQIKDLWANGDSLRIREFLLATAENQRELPKFKRAQDIVFIGHSLGGALAQYGMYHFGAGARRIPCPGHHFICRCYNSPATDEGIDRRFMAFGQKYRALLKSFGQQWQVFYQFEYGDFVPETGVSHLGTWQYLPTIDTEWLNILIHIFTPLKNARALAITTCPTHGRRICEARIDADYRIQTLSPDQLYQFHHAAVLPRRLRKLFGYRILVSPILTEAVRRAIGAILVPFLMIRDKIDHIRHPEPVQRNSDGIFICEYRAAPLRPHYWIHTVGDSEFSKSE
jgi:hypothetical protein